MPDTGFIPVAGGESSPALNVGPHDHGSKSQPAWAAALEAGHARRRLAAQHAVCAALRAKVNAAIAARDDAAGEAAHAELMRAEIRLHRMEGFPVCAADDDVIERGE